MRILIVSQHYWPENFRVTDVAEALVALGHQVTVLAGLPNYPKGYIYNGYRHRKNRIQERHGVTIIRAKEIGRRRNVLFRFLNYWSYQHYAKKLVYKLSDDFDRVLINGLSPIMSAIPGLEYAKKHRKPVLMYEMDLWPESLLAGGITDRSPIYKHYKNVSANIYSRCDKILVSSKEHAPYIKALPGCCDLDIDYLPQYADTLFETVNIGCEDNGVIDLMFAGNVGKAQSVGTIIKAAALLKDDPRFKFHIVGNGSELPTIKKLAAALKTDNVIFYGQRPLEDMPELYKVADAMLVALENKTYANMTIPGKVQSYMAAGKPIIGAIKGSCANFISNNGIGYSCQPENPVDLANAIKSLDVQTLRTIGKHSKQVYFAKYRKSIFMDILTSTLESMGRDPKRT